MLTSLRHTKIVKLGCKNKKLKNFVACKPKKWDSYKILVINISTENLTVKI